MIRRPRIETKINHERWLVSYADFITLLFAFFVVMYSVSHVSEAKYRTLSETLEKTFSPSGKQETQVAQSSETVPSEDAVSVNVAPVEAIEAQLEQAFSGLISSGQLSLSGNEDWVELVINSELLFDSGSAKPDGEAVRLFSEVAEILAPFDNAVAVSGHTDNLPINTSEFQNNWQLSSARAVSVVNLLAFGGVDPGRLSAIGYGEYHPVADNATAEGRAANRRVVLRVARDMAQRPPVAPEQAVVADMPSGNEQGTVLEQGSQTGENAAMPVVEQALQTEPAVEPIRLKNGGLLFTSDPDLPRHQRRAE